MKSSGMYGIIFLFILASGTHLSASATTTDDLLVEVNTWIERTHQAEEFDWQSSLIQEMQQIINQEGSLSEPSLNVDVSIKDERFIEE